MEGISIQIEPCKTYFSDGCVETAAADETDLLRGEAKIQSEDEPVSNTFSTYLLTTGYIIIFTCYFIFLE